MLFDSLNLHFLDGRLPTPNFDRLRRQSVCFSNHFVGSMPCMPARRDIMTGRLSFLHRGWGPIEPFDNCFTHQLREAGVHTHLATDHYHYFEQGGATYHTQYSSYEFFRGQENDPWIGQVSKDLEEIGRTHHRLHLQRFAQNPKSLAYVDSRGAMADEQEMASFRCFTAGLDFLTRNRSAENWFLQIETFDPHEPFHAPARFRALFPNRYDGPILEWPLYAPVRETPAEIAELRANYSALVCYCDSLLGRLLDAFDAYNLWNDTALIVTTDHGFLLGEHDWWGKGQMPIFNEIARIPLYFHHPGLGQRAGGNCDGLTQNVDLMPTILETFAVEPPPGLHGNSLLGCITEGGQRRHALYGYWGSGINATDGRYSYFWYPQNDREAERCQYTLMPTHMDSFFSRDDLSRAELTPGFGFTDGIPVLKIPFTDLLENPNIAGNIDAQSALYDIVADPGQTKPCEDHRREAEFRTVIREQIKEMEAPPELLRRFTV